MELMKDYQCGVNLGGWISQYREKTKEHFDTFIKEEDIVKIAGWGMDHIRLPIDYDMIQADQPPFHFVEDGFEYIRQCIDWCKKHGLNVVLDLHKAPGYSFDTLEENALFDNESMQLRLIRIWEEISHRYLDERDNIIFELLNEIVEPDSSRWNVLAAKLVKAIRSIDPDRKIIIGGNNYNSVHELKNIEIMDDANIIYNFHFYNPNLFTHQNAWWCRVAKDFATPLSYPGDIPGLEDFLSGNPQYKSEVGQYVGAHMDKELLRQELSAVADFMNNTHKTVYCGEYGVYEKADMQSRINWHRDFVDLINEMKIPKCCWTYKNMDFPMVDGNGAIVNEELIQIVSSKYEKDFK